MTLHLSRIALVVTLIGLAVFTPSHRAQADKDECSTRMSEETSRYIREMKISLKGADSEFYSSKAEQVYLLNSEEALKLDGRNIIRNTVAVINHKDSNGKGSFYVIEQEIRPDKVVFFLKSNAKVLQSLQVALNPPDRSVSAIPSGPGVPCNQSQCNVINNKAALIGAQMALLANQTCKRQTYCVQHCMCFAGVQSVSWDIMFIDPTSRRCWIANAESASLSAHLWPVAPGNPLLAQAFDVAIKKQARLYTF